MEDDLFTGIEDRPARPETDRLSVGDMVTHMGATYEVLFFTFDKQNIYCKRPFFKTEDSTVIKLPIKSVTKLIKEVK